MIFKESWVNPFLCALKLVELHVSNLAGMITVIHVLLSLLCLDLYLLQRYYGGNRLSHLNTAVLKTNVE